MAGLSRSLSVSFNFKAQLFFRQLTVMMDMDEGLPSFSPSELRKVADFRLNSERREANETIQRHVVCDSVFRWPATGDRSPVTGTVVGRGDDEIPSHNLAFFFGWI